MEQPTKNDLILAALRVGHLVPDLATGEIYRFGRRVGAVNVQGYVQVPIGGRKLALAHRIVWLAAHGSIPDGLHVNHRNRVRHDNRLCNLDLVTQRENVHHATGGPCYNRVRPEDEEAVDPQWLALVRSLAEHADVTPRQIALLRGQDPDPDPKPFSPYGRDPSRQPL